MMTLKPVAIGAIFSHVKKGADRALPLGRVYGKSWEVCTPANDDGTELGKTKFFKSISSEIDDVQKQNNFFDLVRGIYEASNLDKFKDYYDVETTTECKEAFYFEYGGNKVKVLEVKNRRKKERLYFYCETIGKKRRCVLLLALHKRDEVTPDNVRNTCENQLKEIFKNFGK